MVSVDALKTNIARQKEILLLDIELFIGGFFLCPCDRPLRGKLRASFSWLDYD